MIVLVVIVFVVAFVVASRKRKRSNARQDMTLAFREDRTGSFARSPGRLRQKGLL